VLTDGGPEFKRAFDEPCAALGLRHTRTKPRHAWTNGFVERLQQTIQHEHWRVVFRRHYFTRRAVLHRTLQQFSGSITSNGHTTATAPGAAPRPRSSSARERSLVEFMTNHSGTAEVTTPTRVWTY
jgi:transposase InsO family protein